jgi:hypothetical protein
MNVMTGRQCRPSKHADCEAEARSSQWRVAALGAANTEHFHRG